MTNRVDRDMAMRDAVRPFRMAVSSLNCPIQSIAGDLLDVESSISSLLSRPFIMDFSPFEELSIASREASARHESQSGRLDSQRSFASNQPQVSHEKTMPVFSLRWAAPPSSAESPRDDVRTREIHREPESRNDALGLLDSLANTLLSQRHWASVNSPKSKNLHRTRTNADASRSNEDSLAQDRFSSNRFDARTNDYSLNPLEAMANQLILNDGLSDPLERGDDLVDMFLKGIG